MNRALFHTSYPLEYLSAYKLYWSRANMPSADRLGNGIGEWNKSKHIRPDQETFLCCISLYLDVVEATKRVIQNGRDYKVEYTIKPHFRKWIKDRTWEDFLERAMLVPKVQIAESAPQPTLKPFKAADYDRPDLPVKYRSKDDILAERRQKNAHQD